MRAIKLSSYFHTKLPSSYVKVYQNLNLAKLSLATFSDKMKDKEQAEEKFYFDKEERKLGQMLLKKLKAESKEPLDAETYKQKERLMKLVEFHREKFSEALLDDLLTWKAKQN